VKPGASDESVGDESEILECPNHCAQFVRLPGGRGGSGGGPIFPNSPTNAIFREWLLFCATTQVCCQAIGT